MPTVADDVPDNETTIPAAGGLMFPIMLQVCAVAVKLPATVSAPLIVTASLTGLKITLVFEGVSVYVPF